MKYHALFVIFEKSGKICNRRLLQIIGGALKVNELYLEKPAHVTREQKKAQYSLPSRTATFLLIV